MHVASRRRLPPARRRVGRPANDSHRVAELVAQLVESASFMRATENGGSRHQFVVNCDGRSPA
ncbi:predicted protein [Mycobacterium tuberculosis GM 1503]|nr:predicted protein [Mycobacterium tuberculosis GM 1503]